MKKNIFFILFVFLAASVFAQKFGLDVSLGGSLGIQNIEQKEGIGAEGDLFLPFELGRNDFTGDLKVSSYNYFLLDNMLGAFERKNKRFGIPGGKRLYRCNNPLGTAYRTCFRD